MSVRTALLAAVLLGCAPNDRVDTRVAIEPFVSEGATLEDLPRVAGEPLRVSASGDAWVDVIPLDVRAVAATRERGAAIYRAARPRLDLAYTRTARHVEELWVVGDSQPRAQLSWEVRRGPGIASIVGHNGGLIARDADGVARIHVARPFVVDANGITRAATLSVLGDRMELSAELEGLRAPIVIDPVWSLDASMSVPRMVHTATRIGTDAWIVGGVSYASGTIEHSSAERYDAKLRTFVPIAPMREPRYGHTATPIPIGLLVAGGSDRSTAERFDSATSTWLATAPMKTPRTYHTAVTLLDGRVLVAGGAAPSVTSAVEIYDPTANTWSTVGALNVARSHHRAVRLGDGRVLVAGGVDATASAVAASELFDPAKGTWTSAASMLVPRERHELAVLPSGKVLAFAGHVGFAETSSAEIYDPATNTWTATKPMPQKSVFGGSIALPDGSIFAIASPTGSSGSNGYAFDPGTATWKGGESLRARRQGAAIVALGEGLLITGGSGGIERTTATTEADFAVIANGGACVAATQCVSGHCVGGTCCATTCGACETCKTGTCTAVLDGFSPGCPLGKCVAGACVDTCKTAVDCLSRRCLAGKCVALKKSGEPCDDFRDCETSSCVDGVCCSTSCFGPCATCSAPDAVGKCTFVVGAPVRGTCPTAGCISNDFAQTGGSCNGSGPECSGTTTNCLPFSCRGGTCLSSCVDHTDCGTGFSCDAGRCARTPFRRCNDAATQVIDGSSIMDCTPFMCTNGACTDQCVAGRCRIGMFCAGGRCQADPPSTTPAPVFPRAGKFGCAYGAPDASFPWGWSVAIVLLARRRRAATLPR